MVRGRTLGWSSGLALLLALGSVGWTAGAFLRPGVSVRDGKSQYPVVTADAAGRVYLVWVDRRSTQVKLYFNRADDGGVTWRAEDVAVTPTLPAETRVVRPQVAVDGRGGVWAVWQLAGPTEKTLWGSASRDFGAHWDPPSRLPDLGHAFFPQLVADAQGRVAVLWYEEGIKYRDYALYLATSADRGKTWSRRRVDTGTPPGILSGQRLALDDAGRLYALWWERRGNSRWAVPVFTMSPDFGRTWLDRPIELSSGEKSAMNPELAVGPNGHVYAVWTGWRESGTGDIYLAVSKDHGRTWSAERRLDADDEGLSLLPQVAADPDGHVSVVWRDDRRAGAKSGIYGSFSADSGQTWSPERLLQPAPDGSVTAFPLLRTSGRGHLVLAWVVQPAVEARPLPPAAAAAHTGLSVAISADRGAHWAVLPPIKPWPLRTVGERSGTLVGSESFVLVWEEVKLPEQPAAGMNPAVWRSLGADLVFRSFSLKTPAP